MKVLVTKPPSQSTSRISGLVVKSIVAIDGPRVRFTADAFGLMFLVGTGCLIFIFFRFLLVELTHLGVYLV